MMKRARSEFQTMKFSYMKHCAETVGETNDCAVKALAVICNTDYERARNALADCGRVAGEGAHVYQTIEAAYLLGFKVIKDPFFIKEMLASYPDKTLKHLTTYQPKRFKKQWLGQTTLLFSCYEHMAAYHYGQVHDWSANDPIWIKDVYRVMTIAQYNKQFGTLKLQNNF